MSVLRSRFRITVAALAAGVCLSPPAAVAATKTLPIYKVQAQGLSTARTQSLAKALGITSSIRRVQSVPTFLDPAKFLAVPSVAVSPEPGAPTTDEEGQTIADTAFDLKALATLKTLSTTDAKSRVASALDTAGIEGIGSAVASQTKIGIFGPGASEGTSAPIASKVIGTQVGFRRTLNGLPVVGPGENAGITFAGDGSVSRMTLASRVLSKSATTKALLPARTADARAAQAITGGCPTLGLTLKRRLVYYSPPISTKSRAIVPHYQYEATTPNGGQVVNLLTEFIPAVRGVAPVPSLEASADGFKVSGKVTVKGGRAPYRYSYHSCTGALSGPGDATFSYIAAAREPVKTEKITVAVTDANGITGYDTVEVTLPDGVPPAAAATARPPMAHSSVGGVKDFGISYIGAEQNVPDAELHGLKFASFADNIGTKRYAFGHSAFWDTDYIDPSLGGSDSTYGDNVDLAFVTAHGWPGGFVSGRSDGAGGLRDVQYTEAKWGNGDLEWMALLSCQTIKFNDNGKTLFDRWYKSWAGLHIQLGFSTNASNTADGAFGSAFGFNVAVLRLPIVTSWALAAAVAQPSGRVWGAAGPLKPVPGTNNTQFTSNYNDRLWAGTTSSDIQPTGYYWAVYGQV